MVSTFWISSASIPTSSRPGPQTLLHDPPPLVSLVPFRPSDASCGLIRSLLGAYNAHLLPLRFLLSRPLHRVLSLRRTDRLRFQPSKHRFRARLHLRPGMARAFVGCAEILWARRMEYD